MALETGAAGITNYLISNLKPYDIIHASGKHKELFFIPSGPIPTNPSELMMNPKMGQLFTYLKEHFEYIVIDTSSVGLVSDALLLKPYIDMSIFVVRFAYSKKARLRVLNEFYQNQKLAKPAIVLNGVKLEDNTGYSYYGEETNKGKTASNGKAHSSLNNWIKQNFN